MDDNTKTGWVFADFNGMLEADLLCLSHSDTVTDRAGHTITLRAGLTLTAFDYEADEHRHPDDILASGVVEPSPEYVRCTGSRWALRINAAGIRHASDISPGPSPSRPAG